MHGRDRPFALVVDDDAGARSTLAIALEDEYAVVAVESGRAALDVVAARPVDVALVDVFMPDMDGLEVLTRLKAVDVSLPVVLVSGLSDVSIVVSGMKRGAFDYITKPWNLDVLLAKVRLAAGQRQRPGRSVVVAEDDSTSLVPVALAIELALDVPTTLVAGHDLTPADTASALVIPADNGWGDPRASRDLRARFAGKPVIEVPNAVLTALRRGEQPDVARLATWPVSDLLSQVGRALERGAAPPLARPLHRYASNAVDYITRHYHAVITVTMVATAVGVSADHLNQVFTAALGMTVKDYLTRVRVAVASRLLSHTHTKLDGIAQMSGFTDASHLSRIFTARTGMRPGEYRRRSWNPRSLP